MKMLWFLPLLLAGCSPDGYNFEKTTMDRDVVTVTVVKYSSLTELRKEATKRKVLTPGRELEAFGFVQTDKPTCQIHIVSPGVSYKPQWIGHELTHCLYGQWHS